MALPTYVGAGTAKSDTLPITSVPWPSGHLAGDLGILVIETAAQAPGNNPPSGWTAVPTVSPQSTGTAGAAGATALYVYYRIATSSSEAAADIGDSGDHQIAFITAYRGVDTSAPIGVTAGAVQASASTSVSIPSVTTTGADRLIVLISTNATDGTTTAQLSGVTNAGLANITQRKTTQSGVGFGGGVSVYTGEKATAGATGATTGTLATASAQANITLALQPPSGTAPFGGFYVATGVKSVAGATGNSTGTLQTAQVQAGIILALKPPTPVTNNPPVLDAIPDLFVLALDDLEFQATATDPEGGAITWAINPGSTQVPSGLSIDSLGFIRWTPAIIDQGVWNITVRATDVGGLFDEQTLNITVTGGFASAVEVANRAQVDLDSATALIDLLDQQEQMNANVIRKARELKADLQGTVDYMGQIIADQS